MSSMEGEGKFPIIFRDIRKYYCDYCNLSRSKKSLISSHILSHHQDEIEQQILEEERVKSNICQDCGASFRKPAYLKQHMQSHSIEVGRPPEKLHQASLRSRALQVKRPFICPLEDCNSSYRRKDHLTRHLLQHQGKLFKCPVENCKCEFAYQGNIKRHVKVRHDLDSTSTITQSEKQYICEEVGCGKSFKFASKLRKHEDSHVKLDSTEAVCSEPGCLKYFSNDECLKAHIRSCHQHIICDKCGTKQLKKNMKRHLATHEAGCSLKKIKCVYKDCLHTFANKSNLRQHVKAVHLGLRPFGCRITGCGMRFPFKHVRDNHEKTSAHAYTHGDFVESDERFRMRPRGGRKRKFPGIESLMRKRITSPSQADLLHETGV